MHLIRNSIRFCSYKDRRAVAKALKPIYRAPTGEAAQAAFAEFETEWGDRYAGIVDLWSRSWDRFIPFLDFNPDIRKIIYTTDEIVKRREPASSVASVRRGPRRPVLLVRRVSSRRLVAA